MEENNNQILFEGEIFYPIKEDSFNYSNLVISSSGKILNKKTLKLRKLNNKGCIQIERMKTFNVGRLVGLTFLSEPNIDYSKRRIVHIDKDNTNNDISNLYWK